MTRPVHTQAGVIAVGIAVLIALGALITLACCVGSAIGRTIA